jgi:hypothetical protein
MTDNQETSSVKGAVLTPTTRRIINASADIMESKPYRPHYLHTVMCQVGLPRSRVADRVFERNNGDVTIRLESGAIWNGIKMQEQPLPYGVYPRLIMVHISSEAVQTKTRNINIGTTARQFLMKLGVPIGGGQRGGYTGFKRQMQALAACRLTLGLTRDNRAYTMSTLPIEKFEAWLQHDDQQLSMWPGKLQLSEPFYDTLTEHAVPLDPRALGALKHSATALDIYAWLAHRLWRVRNTNGVRLSWSNLMDQFGQEYKDQKNFQREFKKTLRQVRPVYPDAKLEVVRGGLMLYSSPPPIPKTQVVVELPSNDEYIPWKDRTDLLDPKPR